MTRRSPLHTAIKASLQAQARIKRENASARPALDLDRLQALALERVHTQIHTSALQHSVQIAIGYCAQVARVHQQIRRRNIEARSILQTLDAEAFAIRNGLSSGSARP